MHYRHALYGDYRVTGSCWVECESQVLVGVVDRLCESCGEFSSLAKFASVSLSKLYPKLDRPRFLTVQEGVVDLINKQISFLML